MKGIKNVLKYYCSCRPAAGTTPLFIFNALLLAIKASPVLPRLRRPKRTILTKCDTHTFRSPLPASGAAPRHEKLPNAFPEDSGFQYSRNYNQTFQIKCHEKTIRGLIGCLQFLYIIGRFFYGWFRTPWIRFRCKTPCPQSACCGFIDCNGVD
jgi:hypothetical protein